MAYAGTSAGSGITSLPQGGETEHFGQVVIDGLVILKILKHARENPHEAIQGPLLGLVHQHNLEITNCFPSPLAEEGDSSSAEQYLFTMMRCLREVNVDHLNVGWYHASPLGSYLTEEVIALQFQHQSSIEESVVLIYDPVKTLNGSLSFKAFRLTKKFMDLFRDQDFTPARIKKERFSFDGVFEEVPVVIRCSHLSRVLIDELDRELTDEHRETYDRLDLSTHHFLEKNVRSLMGCVDQLSGETQKYINYLKTVQRQQQHQQQQSAKRDAENKEREEKGLEPLPAEEVKPVPPPSLLDSLLVNGQIDNYCAQVAQFASQSFGKLFLAQGLQTQPE
eukprot:m.479323 g.479323  ORF g.479323 m.479323 type:complete len:336 (+) comp21402_c0_seq1:185-1192(+)